MFKLFLKRRKTLAAAASAMLVASTFQGAGCNVTIDEETLRAVLGVLSEFSGSGEFQFSGEGGSFGGEFGGEFESEFTHESPEHEGEHDEEHDEVQ